MYCFRIFSNYSKMSKMMVWDWLSTQIKNLYIAYCSKCTFIVIKRYFSWFNVDLICTYGYKSLSLNKINEWPWRNSMIFWVNAHITTVLRCWENEYVTWSIIMKRFCADPRRKIKRWPIILKLDYWKKVIHSKTLVWYFFNDQQLQYLYEK